MLGAHVIGYRQKAGEGARDKGEHEADSSRAIRRYLTGKLSCGGVVVEGRALSTWSFGIAFVSNWGNRENQSDLSHNEGIYYK